jgi:hypothetical protein
VEGGRREVAPGEGAYSVPSSCPSPSGEGTQGPGVRAGPFKQAPGLTSISGLSRCGVSDENAMQRGSSRIGQPIRGPDAEQARQPQRVQPGDANAVS